MRLLADGQGQRRERDVHGHRLEGVLAEPRVEHAHARETVREAALIDALESDTFRNSGWARRSAIGRPPTRSTVTSRFRCSRGSRARGGIARAPLAGGDPLDALRAPLRDGATSSGSTPSTCPSSDHICRVPRRTSGGSAARQPRPTESSVGQMSRWQLPRVALGLLARPVARDHLVLDPHLETRAVLRQHASVPIEDAPAHRRRPLAAQQGALGPCRQLVRLHRREVSHAQEHRHEREEERQRQQAQAPVVHAGQHTTPQAHAVVPLRSAGLPGPSRPSG